MKKIFKKIVDIKKDPVFADLKFSNDYTPLQLKTFKNLKIDLAKRMEEDPTQNLTIRHINGNPKIVKSDKPKNQPKK